MSTAVALSQPPQYNDYRYGLEIATMLARILHTYRSQIDQAVARVKRSPDLWPDAAFGERFSTGRQTAQDELTAVRLGGDVMMSAEHSRQIHDKLMRDRKSQGRFGLLRLSAILEAFAHLAHELGVGPNPGFVQH